MVNCMRPYMVDFAVYYLNDILIYSEDPAHHEGHVTEVLERLREYGLYWKAEKCEFSVKNWPTPASANDMQVLVGLKNFYRHFIKKHAKVTSNHRFAKETEREVGVYWGADIAIQKVKRAFTEAPILQHFDTEKPITLQTDASGFAIARFLNQFDAFGILRPTSFYSPECTSAEQNYDTYDRELLAIVASITQGRHHLEGARYKILIQCDHKCHGVGRDINVQCVLIKEMIIIVDHYTLAVRNRR
jgi:hypothetical protein